MSTHTFVFAKITPQAQFFEVAKKAIINIIPQTRAERGCLNFVLHEDTQGNLFLYEEWVNDQALELHHGMDYTASVFEDYKTWLAVPPEITKFNKIA